MEDEVDGSPPGVRTAPVTVDALPQLVWACTLDGACIALNRRWADFTGIPAGEQLGDGWFAQLHPDDVDEFRRAVSSGATTEGIAFESRLRRFDGTYRWFAVRASVEAGEHRDGATWVGSCTDVADDRARRDALAASLDRVREVLTSVPGAVVSVHRDREGHPRVIFANDAFETFYGIPPSALTSDARILRELVHPDDAARVMRAIDKSAEELTILRVRFRLRNPRRGDAWVDFDARPVRHGDGSTVFHAIVRDVSDDVRTEEDARIAQEQLRHALAASDMGAFRSDLRAGEVALDAKASALLALPPDTSAGTVTFDEVMANVEPEDVDRVRTAVDEVRRGERAAVTIEYRVRLGRGDVRWVQSRSVVSLDNDGTPATLTGVLLDVTRERHETELRLRSQKLEAIGTLASGIAHDFNNLLSVMTNAAWFIGDALDKAGDESPWIAASKGDVEHIQRAAESGARLTRQLLAFARRETIDPRPLDLNQTVKELEPFLQRTIGEHVALHVNLAPELRGVFGDAGQIEQILVNLAVNARDAMPGGGLLEIDTQNVDLDDEAHPDAADHVPGHYVRLRVSDSGTGIPSELLDRVFEPFFTTKPSGEGTGLGLATVYGIVTQMGGRARIYSELGHGTTFTALFPATGAIAEVRAASHTVAPARGETILLVEDEPALRSLTGRILTGAGYHVVAAEDGEDAIAIARRDDGPIDLLLTDVVMPRKLGTEVAAEVASHRPHTKVLYMSGYAQPILAAQGNIDEDVELLGKPFSGTELLAKVRDVIDAG